jgi:hypothetical protein
VAPGEPAGEGAHQLRLAGQVDGAIGCFDAKYHYLFWRPLHAIQRAGTDGNPATVPDPSWTPLLVVNHPEYPLAHGCWTSALARSLEAFFGTDRVQLTVDSTVTGTSRTYTRLDQLIADVRLARIAGGLHFRHSMLDGERLGRRSPAMSPAAISSHAAS